MELARSRNLDDIETVKSVNPAPWVTAAGLAEQRLRVTPAAFAQFQCCVFGAGEGQWLPVGAWTGCKGKIETEPGARVWLGVDIGGARSNSALVGVARADDGALEVVICKVFTGDDSVLEVTRAIEDVAQRWDVMKSHSKAGVTSRRRCGWRKSTGS
jgi:hypothetical protein